MTDLSTKPIVSPRLLIRGGTIVNADEMFEADVICENGIITAIGKDLPADGVEKIIDASGKFVMPGGIDPHVHMELPFMGTVSKDDYYTGTRAALSGGTTMIMDFAIAGPGQNLLDAYDMYRYEKAPKACSDYGLHMGLTAWDPAVTPAHIAELCANRGINSFKMFLAYKGALMLTDDKAIEAYECLRENGALPMVHAENGEVVAHMQAKVLAAGVTGPEGHAQSRPAHVEGEAVRRITTIAQVANAPVYVVHVMSIDAMEEVARARMRGVQVYGEPILAGLTLDESKMYDPDWLTAARHVMSPPLRPKHHQRALLEGLAGGVLNLIGTDHCVFDAEQRRMGMGDFTKIPNGLHGVEDRLNVVWDLAVHQTGKLTPSDFVRVTSTTAARIFNIYPRKGVIRVGSDADIAILDPKAKKTISVKTHFQNLDYNAFEGREITGMVVVTVSQGKVVWEDGKLTVERGAGRFVPTPPFSPTVYGSVQERLEAAKFVAVPRE